MRRRSRALAAAALAMGAAALAWSAPAAAADPASLEARLQALEDKEAIRDLLIEYGRLLDARDFKGYAALFAKEGVWIGGFGEFKGPAAIEKMLVDNMGESAASRPDAHSLHLLTNFVVDVDGDRATAESKWVFVQPSAENRPQPLIAGRYLDTLVREDGAWKFLRREAWGTIPFSDPNAAK